MIAREIFAKINSQADFAPQTNPGWLAYVASTMNDAYNEIWYSRAWTFNTKTVDLSVFPDMDAAKALQTLCNTSDTTIPLVAVAGQTYVTITIPSATPTFYGNVDPKLLEQLTGASVEIEGRDYTIVDYKVVDNGSTWTLWFFLDLPFLGAYAASTDVEFTSWKIKFKQYKLPEDCVDVLDVSWSNNRDTGGMRIGQATALSARSAHDFNLNYQLTGAKPYAYIPQMNTYQGDTFQSFTVTQTTGGGTAFSPGIYYFAWEHVDMVTGASSGIVEVQTVTITATNIVSLDWTDNRTLAVGQYRRMLIGAQRASGDLVSWFYASYAPISAVVTPWDPANPYIWRSESTTKSFTPANYASAVSLTGGSLTGGYRGQIQAHYIGNNDRRNIVFYPRLSTADFDKTMDTGRVAESIATIRYVCKCAPIVDQYDNLQIPAEFQQLVVFKSLEAVCLKFDKDTQARYYAGKFQEQYNLLRSQYSNDRNIIAQKRNSMGISGGGLPRYNITFTRGNI